MVAVLAKIPEPILRLALTEDAPIPVLEEPAPVEDDFARYIQIDGRSATYEFCSSDETGGRFDA